MSNPSAAIIPTHFDDIHTPELERLDIECTTSDHQLTIIRHVPLWQINFEKYNFIRLEFSPKIHKL